jgi:hypothetical protein
VSTLAPHFFGRPRFLAGFALCLLLPYACRSSFPNEALAACSPYAGSHRRGGARFPVRYKSCPMSDPAYLKAFKNFAKSRPNIADRRIMEKEFYGENDRACGILQASWVEQMLETAIKARLGSESHDKLFDFEGPLGTFSAKTIMGYALGLFGAKTNHDLLLIRMIRNEFAHCQLPLRFDIPEVKAVCNHLQIPDTEAKVIPSYLIDMAKDIGLAEERPDNWSDRQHPKTRFVICCYSIIYQLFEDARHLTPQSMTPSILP